MLTRLIPSHLLAPRLRRVGVHRAHIPAHAVRSLILLAVLIGAFAGRGGADAQGSGGEIVTLTLSSEAVGTLMVSWATPTPTPDDYRLSWARADLDFLSYLNPNEAQRGNEYPLGDATSLILSGLTPGAEYKVQFRSRYHVEGSVAVLWSGPWRSAEPVRVRASPPAAPTGLSAVASDGVVDLVWTAPADSVISAYRILRGANGGDLATLVADTDSPLTVYRDDTVEAGQAYVYAVVALSGDLESAPSATASVTTPEESSEQESVDDEELVAPGAPSGLSAVASDGFVDLIWTAPADSVVSGYQILRGASGEELETLVADTGSPLAAFHDATVEAGGAYVYAVVALNGDLESSVSATASAKVPGELQDEDSKGTSDPLLAGGLGTSDVQARQGISPSAPVITGILEVGLSASYSFPESSYPEGYEFDGLEWIRVDDDTETVIRSFGSFYTIREADLGKRLKVRVLLWNGSELAFTSDASGVVRAAPSYLSSNLHTANEEETDERGGNTAYDHSAGIIADGQPAIAQAFTTSGTAAELAAVRVQMRRLDPQQHRTPKVSIYSDVSDLPGTSLHVLTNPTEQVLQADYDSAYGAGTTEEFTATGVTLSANTKYWLVFESMYVAGRRGIAGTGWSIDGNNYEKDSDGNWTAYSFGDRAVFPLAIGLVAPQTSSAPSFATKPLTFSVNENAASGTVVGTAGATDADGDPLTYSVSGTDAAAFAQVFAMNMDTGEIEVRDGVTVDHESKGSYMVTINVTDGEDGSGATEGTVTIDDTVDVTINVTDVDEPGAVALSPLIPAVNRPLTATLADPDGASGETWTWSWAMTPGGSFTTISGANTTSYTPVVGDAGRYLKAAVSYTDAFGSGQSAELVSANAVSGNPAPVFGRPSVIFAVNENATSGTVGAVTASDPEGETVTYAIDRADLAALRAFSGDFSLNAATGAITVKPDATIDHESAPSYAVVITATDTSGVTAKANVTINVTDVNELGTVDLSPATPWCCRRLDASLTDPDGAVSAVTWTWSRASTSTGSFTTILGERTPIYSLVAEDEGYFMRATASYTDAHGPGQSATVTSAGAASTNKPPLFEGRFGDLHGRRERHHGDGGPSRPAHRLWRRRHLLGRRPRRGGVQRRLQRGSRRHDRLQRDDHGPARRHHRLRRAAVLLGARHRHGL